MFVFGGYNGNGGYRDKTRKILFLNLKNETWSQLNNISYQNRGHTANLIRDSIYLFGGENITNRKHTNDLIWLFLVFKIKLAKR